MVAKTGSSHAAALEPRKIEPTDPETQIEGPVDGGVSQAARGAETAWLSSANTNGEPFPTTGDTSFMVQAAVAGYTPESFDFSFQARDDTISPIRWFPSIAVGLSPRHHRVRGHAQQASHPAISQPEINRPCSDHASLHSRTSLQYPHPKFSGIGIYKPSVHS